LLVLTAIIHAQDTTQGTLRGISQGKVLGDCPLKHTAVTADIAGAIARVKVVQQFQNSFQEPIEAVYTFPLPHDAAVDSMTMTIGGRIIKGNVRERNEAAALYKTARDMGRPASLLDQERPNIFTQRVANILSGDSVKIEIGYSQVLKFEDGSFEFAFPMVVGPRYIPAGLRKDAARLTPAMIPEGMRAGHDVSIQVSIDAGQTIADPVSKAHAVDITRVSPSSVTARLRDQNTIPNKDFILRYEAAGRTVQEALLTHRSARDGYFTLVIEPPRQVLPADALPKELIFVLDTSGSMSGFPVEKAKEAMRMALEGLYPQDTFNLITFSGDTDILFPEPVPSTPENRAIAQLFLQSRAGSGGTEMMKAIRAALEGTPGSGRVRIVCFMTDGLVGNDLEILAEIRRHADVRVFAFGIGQSPNRFLLDGMAAEGRGEVEYVGLQDDGSAAARRFHDRIRNPLLTDISIDWRGLPVTDVYPKRIPDLFSAKPVVVTGRFTGPARGSARLVGKAAGRDSAHEFTISLPVAEPRHESVATLWARQRIADLMSQDYAGAQKGTMRPDLQQQITQTGLDYQLVTQFTSFVAVEEKTVTYGGQKRRVEVPVEMPEGVSYDGVFGPQRLRVGGNVAGIVGGMPGGVIGGIAGGGGGTLSAMSVSPPPARAAAPVSQGRIDAASPKLDPALATLVKTGPGKVTVRILLRDASAATLQQLANIGVEILRPAGKDLIATGRIDVAKLMDLAAVAAVRYVVQEKEK
jgi:Ca-activated chloride channel family protein